eukprot:1984942-Heterocapsa_arctica.AAC.1
MNFTELWNFPMSSWRPPLAWTTRTENYIFPRRGGLRGQSSLSTRCSSQQPVRRPGLTSPAKPRTAINIKCTGQC